MQCSLVAMWVLVEFSVGAVTPVARLVPQVAGWKVFSQQLSRNKSFSRPPISCFRLRRVLGTS